MEETSQDTTLAGLEVRTRHQETHRCHHRTEIPLEEDAANVPNSSSSSPTASSPNTWFSPSLGASLPSHTPLKPFQHYFPSPQHCLETPALEPHMLRCFVSSHPPMP